MSKFGREIGRETEDQRIGEGREEEEGNPFRQNWWATKEGNCDAEDDYCHPEMS